ncbi:MAG: transglutaminase-like domain-containing protein, partial [Peptococcaceae bacterium]|nr:transglutaminase-like domain-containing protein [Peptococcaceae bacterium]
MKKWLVSAGLLVCLLLAFSTPVLADTMLGNDKAQVDVANLASGYVKVAYTGGQDKKVKLRITAPNKVQYDYALNNQGTFEIFPLTEGNGKYTISVYVNVSDAKYSVAFTTDADVKLSSEFAPFLVANQYVNYSHSSAVVAKAAELSKGKTSDLEKVNAIYNYVVTTFTYDTVKAQSVQSGYIPIVDN